VDAQFAFPDQIDNALQPRFGGVDFLRCKPGSEAAGVNGKYEYSKQRKIGFVITGIMATLSRTFPRRVYQEGSLAAISSGNTVATISPAVIRTNRPSQYR
jgi:hypothetical protein